MSRYARLALKTIENSPPLGERESPFSDNRVTGESLNFPIAQTCRPSKVCAKTCYAACGPITWNASIAKQHRNLTSCRADPIAFARRVLEHRKADFITWNGAGDLFYEAVFAINYIGEHAPEVPVWVRTRRPDLASCIAQAPNVWVHFSLDRESMHRADSLRWLTTRHHYSYQYAPDELGGYPPGMRVVFGHDYRLPPNVSGPEVCPLNLVEDITGACAKCKRCFTD